MNNEKLKAFLETAMVSRTRDDANETTYMVFNEDTEFRHHWKKIKAILFKSGFRINDFHYDVLSDAFDSILIHLEDGNEISTFEPYEFTSAEPYTYNLLKWLEDDLENIEYVDVVIEEMNCKNFVDLLQYSQERAQVEIFKMAVDVVEYLMEVEE